MLKKFKIEELILIAMLAGLGTASKVVIGPLIRLLTGSIGIPGGAIAGGMYMLWLALSVGITKRKGAATLLCTVQALMVFALSLPGSHGLMSIVTYVLPGIACDLVFLISKNRNYNILHYLISVAIANIVGTIGSNLLFFRLPIIPLLFTLLASAFSGALGGLLAYGIIRSLAKGGIIKDDIRKDLKVYKHSEPNDDKGE